MAGNHVLHLQQKRCLGSDWCRIRYFLVLACFIGAILLLPLSVIEPVGISDEKRNENTKNYWKMMQMPPIPYTSVNNPFSRKFLTFTEILNRFPHAKKDIKTNVNMSLSNSLPLSRDIPDARPDGCVLTLRKKIAKANVSIIITVHDELWSVILRTVESVLHRTPYSLLQELIIIDDVSGSSSPRSPLEDFLLQYKHILKLVIHLTIGQKGHVESKMLGASIARGAVLVFLDSHTEVGLHWLEPLLSKVKPNKVVQPVIDSIVPTTLEYTANAKLMRKELKWDLTVIQNAVARGKQRETETVFTPIVSPRCFAVYRKTFNNVGGFDVGMKESSGYELEFSLRFWQCIGRMEIVPCSRVGFIHTEPEDLNTHANDLLHNRVRTAEKWLGAEKEMFYRVQDVTVKDLSKSVTSDRQQQQLLKCKDFNWYTKNVQPQLQPLPKDVLYYGKLKNKASNLCVGLGKRHSYETLTLELCDSNKYVPDVAFTKDSHIMIGSRCLGNILFHVALKDCNDPEIHKNTWKIVESRIVHVTSAYCLMHVSDSSENGRQIVMLMSCDHPDGLWTSWDFDYRLFS